MEDVFIVPEWTGSRVRPGRWARAKGCQAGGHVGRTGAGGGDSNGTLRGRQRRSLADVAVAVGLFSGLKEGQERQQLALA